MEHSLYSNTIDIELVRLPNETAFCFFYDIHSSSHRGLIHDELIIQLTAFK